MFAILAAAGCAPRRSATAGVPPPPAPNSRAAPAERPVPPGTYVEQGVASWYGIPFHGRQSSSGEVFDMNKFVAAHRTLPFGSVVRVTNLNNGKHTEVRVIDRGPFVRGRLIDLSLAAAHAIDMVGTGIAPVRLELVSSPAPLAGDFSVQVGAFQQRGNADRLRKDLSRRYPGFRAELRSARRDACIACAWGASAPNRRRSALPRSSSASAGSAIRS